MPKLTRCFVKAAMVYLILALSTGISLAWPGGSPLSGLFPVYFHTLAFGWLTQLIFGIALWMFPKYSSARPRGHEWLGWAVYFLLNAGLILRMTFEPLNSESPTALGGLEIGSA